MQIRNVVLSKVSILTQLYFNKTFSISNGVYCSRGFAWIKSSFVAPFVVLYNRLNYMIESKQTEKDLKSNLFTPCLDPPCNILVTLSHFLCLNTPRSRELTFWKGSWFHFLDNPEFYQVLSYIESKCICSIHLKPVGPHGRSPNTTLRAYSGTFFSHSSASSSKVLLLLHFCLLFYIYLTFELKRKKKWKFWTI